MKVSSLPPGAVSVSHSAAGAEPAPHPFPRTETGSEGSDLGLLFRGENLAHFQPMPGTLFLQLRPYGIDLFLLGQDLLLIGVGLGPQSPEFQLFGLHFVPQRKGFLEEAFTHGLHLLVLLGG